MDPLSAAEITAAVEAVKAAAKAKLGAAAAATATPRFSFVTLKEPLKPAYLAWRNGTGPVPPREALAQLQMSPAVTVYEAVVDLATGSVTNWKEVGQKACGRRRGRHKPAA